MTAGADIALLIFMWGGKAMKANCKICAILCSLFAISFLTACPRVEKTEYKTVQVVIDDTYYCEGYSTTITDSHGHVTGMKYHPATFYVKVIYKNKAYHLYGEKDYYLAVGHIGDKFDAVLRVILFDNGKVKEKMMSLKYEQEDKHG